MNFLAAVRRSGSPEVRGLHLPTTLALFIRWVIGLCSCMNCDFRTSGHPDFRTALILRPLLVFCVMAWCLAVEVTLDLPEPLIPGVEMSGSVLIKDPADNVRSVDLPPVSGLTWELSGQNGSNTSIINGKRSATISVGIVARAEKRGVLKLPAVTVHFTDGSTATSTPRQLRVADGDARLKGDAVAEATFDPPTIVPGQPSKLVYKIWLHNGQVNKIGINPPEGTISLGERTIVESKTFAADGTPWTLVTITWPLTHATPGTFTVRGQQEYLVVLGNDFFNQRTVRRQIAVAPTTLTVEQLPTIGRPADYYGLIGPLSARASLERERVSAGEGVALSVTVSGRQIDLVKRPTLTIAGVQVYTKDESSGEGHRTFRWDIVPTTAGTITIPVLSFPYFDPNSASYRSADTTALTLQVIPGRNRDLGIVGTPTTPTTSTPVIQAITTTLPAPLKGSVLPSPPPWSAPIALAGGVLIGFGFFVTRRLVGSRRGPHRGRALRAAGTDLVKLDAALRALRPALTSDAQRAAADALQQAIDHARFGGGALPDLSAWLQMLGAVA